MIRAESAIYQGEYQRGIRDQGSAIRVLAIRDQGSAIKALAIRVPAIKVLAIRVLARRVLVSGEKGSGF